MARSVTGRLEDGNDEEGKKESQPMSATPQSPSPHQASIQSSLIDSPSPAQKGQTKPTELKPCPIPTPLSEEMFVDLDGRQVEQASQQTTVSDQVETASRKEHVAVMILSDDDDEDQDKTVVIEKKKDNKDKDENSDDWMKSDDKSEQESNRSEGSNHNETDKESQQESPKKSGRVSARLSDKKANEKPKKTPTKKAELETYSRKEKEASSSDTESMTDVWVEISRKKRSTSDTDEEDTEDEEAKKSAKKVKSAPLAEKSSNVTRASTRGKTEKKETKSVTTAKSTRASSRQSKEDKLKPKLTPRQKDLREIAKSNPKPTQLLNLPSGFEKPAKKALQLCFNDKKKAVEGDNILILLDLFQHYNDPDLTDDSKEKRLTRLSRILNFETDKKDSMRGALALLQQRILLWAAEEELIGKSSGLKSKQAVKALEIMADVVEEHGPADRLSELLQEREFKVKTLNQLRVRSKELIKSAISALKTGELKP